MIRNTQGAEDILRKYEDELRKVYTVPTDTTEVETYRTELKVTAMSMSQLRSQNVFVLSLMHLQNCLLSFVLKV